MAVAAVASVGVALVLGAPAKHELYSDRWSRVFGNNAEPAEYYNIDADEIVRAVEHRLGFTSILRINSGNVYEYLKEGEQYVMSLAQTGGFSTPLQNDAFPLANGFTGPALRAQAFSQGNDRSYVIAYGFIETPHVAAQLFDESIIVDIDPTLPVLEQTAEEYLPWGRPLSYYDNIDVRVTDATVDILRHEPGSFDSIVLAATDFEDPRAAKMWTGEWIERVKRRLADGGTLSVSLHIGMVSVESLAAVEKTLFGHFAYCAYTFGSEYELGISCGDTREQFDDAERPGDSLVDLAKESPRWSPEVLPTLADLRSISIVRDEPALFVEAANLASKEADPFANSMVRPETTRFSEIRYSYAGLQHDMSRMSERVSEMLESKIAGAEGGREHWCNVAANLFSVGTRLGHHGVWFNLPDGLCVEPDALDPYLMGEKEW